ncbi:rhomboid family intramembrane serine protease [Nonlabens spongiae]|uniref:Rhomboid family intramembrane serine protease n=1 Tax=Nonlabens spongiae TaxID=331648 RepID=A0A1W6MK96_9FLAO|nr:rhomboid family intramembrane serine protease [Nonlabens spongiae]ARN77936.1 rhomboid family intramembrane serine protease [Nonlabens spongiae]
MSFLDDAKSKYNSWNTSGRLMAIIAITSIIGWIMQRFYEPLFEQFMLPAGFVPALLQPWSYITHAFLHSGLFHLLGNLLGLFYAAQFFLNIFRGRQYLSMFFLGVLGGGAAFTLATFLLPSYFSADYALGASAGVFALIIFVCTYLPESEIRLIFFNIKLKYVGYAFLAINLFALTSRFEAGSGLGHLAGMVVGYYAAIRMKDGIDILEPVANVGDFFANLFQSSSTTSSTSRSRRSSSRKSSSRMKTVYRNSKTKTAGKATKTSRAAAPNQADIDKILDKISASGYDSLSKDEKDTLFKAGKD